MIVDLNKNIKTAYKEKKMKEKKTSRNVEYKYKSQRFKIIYYKL